LKAFLINTLFKLLLFSILLFLTFNKQSRNGVFTYKSQIWGDKAGYYVYLPAAFKYQFNSTLFPDSIATKTGNGFKLNLENQIVYTKYSLGVALMQMPFYLLADVAAKPLGFKNDGFSLIYHWAIDVAAVFYLTLALLLLNSLLLNYCSRSVAFLSLLFLFGASNLYYYGIAETGMSHVYSFFLFAAFLKLAHNFSSRLKLSFSGYLLLGLVSGLIVLIRPTNIIFLSAGLFFHFHPNVSLFRKIKALPIPQVLMSLLIAFLVLVPQFLYWKYSSGNYIHYAYSNEGFIWSRPLMLHTLFSPNNGFILYSPLFLFVLVGIYLMKKQQPENALYLALLFAGITYLFSCWWSWEFGCAFGARSYVEFWALFLFPLAAMIKHILEAKVFIKWTLLTILTFFFMLNLEMIYIYDGCYYGNGAWDWEAYLKLLPI